MELVSLGKVVKLHGYLGQMKIITKYDKDFDIKKITKIYDDKNNEYTINRIFSNTESIVVGLDGVDLEKAKTFIGKELFIDRTLVSEKILIEDLKNSEVYFEDSSKLGRVTDVQDYGTAEVFYLELVNGRELLFPNVKGVITNFDYKEKKLVVSKDKLKEVSDYEDWYSVALSKYVWTTQREYYWPCNQK